MDKKGRRLHIFDDKALQLRFLSDHFLIIPSLGLPLLRMLFRIVRGSSWLTSLQPLLAMLLLALVVQQLPVVQSDGNVRSLRDAGGGGANVTDNIFQQEQQNTTTTNNPACSVCGAEMFMGDPNATVKLSFAFQNDRSDADVEYNRSYSCGTLQALGLEGNIPIDICTSNLTDIIREPCQCQQDQQQQEEGDVNSTAPSSVPMVEADDSNSNPNDEIYPSCSICGLGESVDNPNAMIPQTSILQSIAGKLSSSSSSSFNGTNVTCSDLQLAGFEGYVSPDDCSNLYDTLQDACQCTNLNTNKTSNGWRNAVAKFGATLAFLAALTAIWSLRMYGCPCRNRDHTNSGDTNDLGGGVVGHHYMSHIADHPIYNVAPTTEDPEIRRTVLMMLFPEKPQQKDDTTEDNEEDEEDDEDHDGSNSGQQHPQERLQHYDPESLHDHQQQRLLLDNEDDDSTKVNELAVCSICLEVIGLEDPVVNGIQCHHIFHHSCIFDWLTMEQQYHNDCPMCRQPMWDPEEYKAAVKKQEEERRKSATASYVHSYMFHT